MRSLNTVREDNVFKNSETGVQVTMMEYAHLRRGTEVEVFWSNADEPETVGGGYLKKILTSGGWRQVN